MRACAGCGWCGAGSAPGDLAGQPWLVVAATDDEALHARVAALCRQRRTWVNVVDRPRCAILSCRR
ncbi:MAG: NAD(P)-dependent oxidoreductase [Elusimicrobia bacterium]|nr:NAD(P)-dependent oxidoreductase [Elusimicrobiota bacterium]